MGSGNDELELFGEWVFEEVELMEMKVLEMGGREFVRQTMRQLEEGESMGQVKKGEDLSLLTSVALKHIYFTIHS